MPQEVNNDMVRQNFGDFMLMHAAQTRSKTVANWAGCFGKVFVL